MAQSKKDLDIRSLLLKQGLILTNAFARDKPKTVSKHASQRAAMQTRRAELHWAVGK